MNQETSIVPSQVSEIIKTQDINVLVGVLKEVIKGDLQEVIQRSPVILEHAQTKIKIQTEGDLTPATEFLAEIKKKIKTVKGAIEEYKKKANKLHKGITGFENEILEPLKEAERIASQKVSAFMAHQDAERLKAQLKADEKASREEAKRKAELEAQAQRHEEKGNLDKAQERRDLADAHFEPTPIIPEGQRAVKTEKGSLSASKDIKVTITNPCELLKAIMDKRIPITAVDFKLGIIKTTCKNMGYSGRDIPGLHIEKVFSARVRTI